MNILHRSLPLSVCLWMMGCTHPVSPHPTGLAAARQQARRAGITLEANDLALPPLPANQNAAPLYQQIMRQLDTHPLQGDDTLLEMAVGRRMPDQKQMASLRRAVQHQQPLLELVHQAANRPECRFDRDYSLGPNLLLPELAKVRSSLNFLTGQSTVLLADGKPLQAIENETAGFQIARQASSDPLIMGGYLETACDALTLIGLEKILYVAGERPGVAQAVQKAITQHYLSPRPMSYYLQGEVITGMVVLEKLRNEGPDAWEEQKSKSPSKAEKWQKPAGWDAMIDANETAYLLRARAVADSLDKPYPQAVSGLNAVHADAERQKSDRNQQFNHLLMPDYNDWLLRRAQAQARLGIVRAMAAVMDWKTQQGAFPEILEKAMASVPQDPFSTQPVRYRRTEKGFVVYSIGQTGKFDGGSQERKPTQYETFCWYPLPSYEPALKKPVR